MRLRLLLSPPADGPTNMAVDEALLARARATGEACVRVYSWSAPTLSFGRHQRAAGVYDPARLAERGIAAVRRPTGGRAVLHAREVTYSVTAPLGALAPSGAPVAASHARIHRMLAAALARLGVDARVAAPAGRAPRPDAAPCFERPTGGEIVVGPGPDAPKLVGSAQWQEGGALLQHGSILVDDDQRTVAELAHPPLPTPPAPATLRALLGRAPAADEVAASLFAAAPCLVGDGAAGPAEPLDDAEQRAVAADAAARAAAYRDAAWTWRR